MASPKQFTVIAVPERICALWSGFAAFALAFFGRLAVSGDPASAIFVACVACLIGCWFGKAASSYLNANLNSEPSEMDLDEDETPAEGVAEAAKT